MNYALLMLIFGVMPLFALWLIRPELVRRHAGSLLAIVLLILLVSVPWELVSVNRIWYYSPRILSGQHLLGLPVEELLFFVIDGLLVGTVALYLEGKR
jgi:lycopene cyclase domain-containing protein